MHGETLKKVCRHVYALYQYRILLARLRLLASYR